MDKTCLKCNKTFSTLNGLIKHMKYCILGISYQCSFCNKQYVNRQNLLRHVKNTHTSSQMDNLPIIRYVN